MANSLPDHNDFLAALTPNAYEHLIEGEFKGLEGIGLLIDEIKENSSMRSALLLRSATVLRDRLRALSFETSTSEPVTIEAQDAVVLLDLLLRRIG